MSNELTGSAAANLGVQYLNEDNTPATWVTYPTRAERIRLATLPTLIGGALTVLLWGIQFRAGALAENWPFALWPLGISLFFAITPLTTTEVRHYSTVFTTYTHRQRLGRAWKWWAIPAAMAAVLWVLQYSLEQLADNWASAAFLLVFTLPGFGLYMLKGERVLTPAAAKAKSFIDAANVETQRNGGKKSRLEECISNQLDALLAITWVRYMVAIACFWLSYLLANQQFKSDFLRIVAALFAFGFGVYFAREVSKWIFGIAALGLIAWAAIAGFAALSIPAAIIIGAIIIAGSTSKR